MGTPSNAGDITKGVGQRGGIMKTGLNYENMGSPRASAPINVHISNFTSAQNFAINQGS